MHCRYGIWATVFALAWACFAIFDDTLFGTVMVAVGTAMAMTDHATVIDGFDLFLFGFSTMICTGFALIWYIAEIEMLVSPVRQLLANTLLTYALHLYTRDNFDSVVLLWQTIAPAILSVQRLRSTRLFKGIRALFRDDSNPVVVLIRGADSRPRRGESDNQILSFGEGYIDICPSISSKRYRAYLFYPSIPSHLLITPETAMISMIRKCDHSLLYQGSPAQKSYYRVPSPDAGSLEGTGSDQPSTLLTLAITDGVYEREPSSDGSSHPLREGDAFITHLRSDEPVRLDLGIDRYEELFCSPTGTGLSMPT